MITAEVFPLIANVSIYIYIYIGAWNFWPGTRLSVNKLKRHTFVCFTT